MSGAAAICDTKDDKLAVLVGSDEAISADELSYADAAGFSCTTLPVDAVIGLVGASCHT